MNSLIKKRGQYHPAAILLIPLISLALIFGFFFLPVLADIMGIQETTYFEKNFLVRDITTVINALYASPGNIIVNYDKSTYWFSYEFNKDDVAVFDETSTLKMKTRYPIISNGLNFNPIELNAEFNNEDKSQNNLKEKVKPVFAKINDDIFINADKSINELKCIDTEPIGELQNKVILVDAGHGGEDDGVIANNIKEKDITGAIGLSLYESLNYNNFFTREEPPNQQIRKMGYRSKEKITEEVGKNKIDIIISIHIGSYDDNSNNIKAYYSIESNKDIQVKSRKIACEVLNELLKEELDITGISIIGIYPEDYEGGEILVKDKIAVLFEIGNVKNEKSVSVLTKPENIQSISNSIIRGLKKC